MSPVFGQIRKVSGNKQRAALGLSPKIKRNAAESFKIIAKFTSASLSPLRMLPGMGQMKCGKIQGISLEAI